MGQNLCWIYTYYCTFLSLSLSLFSPIPSPPPSLFFTYTAEPNKEVCTALVQMFLSFVDDQTLNQFIQLFLLQSNSSSLRWQAHRLLHTLYQYSQSAEQVQLIDQLWKLWPSVPTYGQKATQFVDLLGFMTISTPQVLEKVHMLFHDIKLHVPSMIVYNWLGIASSEKIESIMSYLWCNDEYLLA